MSSFLLRTTLFMLCLESIQGGADIVIRLQTYSVDGRDDNEDKCDTIFTGNTECDPKFKFCLDHPDGGDTSFDICTLANYPETHEYQGQNNVHFIEDGYLPGNGVKNPLKVTVGSYVGFKLKVRVVDDDSGYNGHDPIDQFSYRHTARPSLSAAQANWVGVHQIGRRPNSPSQLFFKLLIYCHDNYYGPACDKYCKAEDSDVAGHFTCDPQTGDIVCRPLWENTAEKCTIWKDDCSSNPCLNGAECVDKYRSYTCTCVLGFKGTNCEEDVNECLSNPCKNGGTCIDGINSYTCNCPSQYSGALCEHHMCGGSLQGCQNGGACIQDNNGQPTCYCPARYTGEHCEVDKCQVLICQNGGHCIDGSCQCPSSHTGALCDVDRCSVIQCENGGSCVTGECRCQQGFSGKYCHVVNNQCVSNPCKHDGTCYSNANGYTCRCLPNYNGTHCENVLLPVWKEKVEQQVDTDNTDTEKNKDVAVSSKGPQAWMIGLIAAIVLLIVVIVVVAAVCIRQRRHKETESSSTNTAFNVESPGTSYNNPVFAVAATPQMPSVADKVKNYDNVSPGAVGGAYDNNNTGNEVLYDNPKRLQTSSYGMNPRLANPDDWTSIKKNPGQSKAIDNPYTTMIDFDGSAHNNNTNDRLEQEK